MATHYSYTFESQPISGTTGKTYKVLIRDTDYAGTDEIILKPDSDGFTLNWEGATSETYQPFITSTVSIGLYIDANVRQLISDVIKGNEAKFTVVIYEITLSTSAPKWQGIVLREEITVPDSTESIVTITANDGFGLLKDSQYTYTSGNSRTLLDYLAEISLLLKHDKTLLNTQPCWRLASVWVENSKTISDDPLGLNQIDEAAFATVDDFGLTVTKSYYEILEQFLLAFNLQISQWNGVFMFVQQNSYGSYTTIHYWDYAYDGTAVDNDDLTLLADMPDRFEGGSYSYILPVKEVTTEYEFKQGIFNKNLLPYDVNKDTGFNLGKFSASDYLRFAGSIETFYSAVSGGLAGNILARYKMIVTNGSYYLGSYAGVQYWSILPAEYVLVYSVGISGLLDDQRVVSDFVFLTPVIPDSTSDVIFRWEFIDFVEASDLSTYTPPGAAVYSSDDVEGTFNVNVNGSTATDGTYRYKTTVSNSALATLELPNAVIGDGPGKFTAGAIAVDVSGTFENSDLWQIYGLTASTNYPLHSLRCIEMLALRRYVVPLYSGNFFGAPDIHKSVEFAEYGGATESWIWTSINWNANMMAYTGTLMQIKTSRASFTVYDPVLKQDKTSGGSGSVGGTTDPISYVPYTGATGNVDLGSNTLTATEFYITADWRIVVSGANLLIQKYNAGSLAWVTKQTISG